MAKYIERESVKTALWNALYSFEDENEKRFIADPELDVTEWFFHRIFVQSYHANALQAVLDTPTADVRPVVLCRDCEYCRKVDEFEYWCEGFCSAAQLVRKDDFCSHGKAKE